MNQANEPQPSPPDADEMPREICNPVVRLLFCQLITQHRDLGPLRVGEIIANTLNNPRGRYAVQGGEWRLGLTFVPHVEETTNAG